MKVKTVAVCFEKKILAEMDAAARAKGMSRSGYLVHCHALAQMATIYQEKKIEIQKKMGET